MHTYRPSVSNTQLAERLLVFLLSCHHSSKYNTDVADNLIWVRNYRMMCSLSAAFKMICFYMVLEQISCCPTNNTDRKTEQELILTHDKP